MKIIFLFTTLLFNQFLFANNKQTITVEAKLSPSDYTDYVAIQYTSAEAIDKFHNLKTNRVEADKGFVRWIINIDNPILISIKSIFKSQTDRWIWVEPGDKIQILSTKNQLFFSGLGSEKIKLKYQIDSLLRNIPRPTNPSDFSTASLEDYFEWNDYLDKKLEVVLPYIDLNKSKLSDRAYKYIRGGFIDQNIDDKGDKFGSFLGFAKEKGLSDAKICTIYDSIYYPRTARWFSEVSQYMYGNYSFIRNQVYRKYAFNFDAEPLKDKAKRTLLIYEACSNTYMGLPREQFIVEYFPTLILYKFGLTPLTEKLLSEYYADKEFPKYKLYLKNLELNYRRRLNSKNAPDFSLVDKDNLPFTKGRISNKVALLYFWSAGFKECIASASELKRIATSFKNDTNFVLINICVDQSKDQWLSNTRRKEYTPGGGIDLYTGGQADKHDMIRQYAVERYPATILLDAQGRVVEEFDKLQLKKDYSRIMKLLQKQLTYLSDGPYIIHDANNSFAYSINGQKVVKNTFSKSDLQSFKVQTDINKPFNISLSDKLAEEPSEFSRPQKLLALSDIEGNFDSFRKLLQANNVMDDHFNWIFGKGHLVFAGDMFDRGQQVTECLWLIYSLEQKAKAAGGYVHFILGNHEVMNLYGDTTYVQQKYMHNSRLIGKSLKELYGENSELGKWLRTKSVIEKIGDLLFVHGGMSKEFSDSVALSISEINDIVRRHLGQEIDEWKQTDRNMKLIYSASYSPFWFRMYYNDGDKHLWRNEDHSVRWTIEKPDEKEMENILKRWRVSRIITGHTIVADTISVHYAGKVINTDTHHAEGKSEALLIEGDKFYRVNDKGRRWLLLDENKRKAIVPKSKD